jgi:hypothetical protein
MMQIPRFSRTALAALPLLAALAVSPVQAQTDDARTRARALVQEGAHLYDQGDYDGAWEKFEAARRLFPSPKLFFNLGLALRGLAREAEAVEAFERFLAEAKDAPAAARAEAREAIASLSARLGQIRVECNTEGAVVSLDGRDVGVTPRAAPVRASDGLHQVVVARKGWPAFVERVRVNAGATVTVRATLAAPSSVAPPVAPVAANVETAVLPRPADDSDLSHAGQFGVALRFDLALHPESGQRLLPGLTYGLGSIIELTGGAILGKQSKGAFVGGRAFLLPGRWKPELSFSIPFFFLTDEIDVGLQLGAGLNVDLSPHAGLFVSLGGAAFPRASVSADRFWLLISSGVEARF